ncbi:1,2-phenylacetyl-CoA epoxidase subunit PaaD [Actinacidiphila sp. ITFR-21]|uniref:1,2-phenylacetyl-CoA epoxidase subunit PaaD n=1 Tax=Actinacidiphila sp. ITFR-21 TaxID=3075199 RepID=UPI00288AF943|nr:1,2-phenylacetyl-CoA epoxidase subunit PaaD [Streptomyces sp. ITFR-21]WNI18897.1 1,2-phenylacetyl-CoA epoxidase subunit PaaD [Streptomyces sp. ITFR-21]
MTGTPKRPAAPAAEAGPGAPARLRTAPARLRAALATVCDPEIRVLSLEELGVLRSARIAADGTPVVTVTPTYVGCPAMDVIRADIEAAVLAAGYRDVRVETVWSPAWSTDWIGPRARAKLEAAGIAPPARGPAPAGHTAAAPAGRRLLPLSTAAPRCPRCGAADTEEVTRFGSTACKALWRCRSCLEPFDHLKEH